MKKIFLIGIGVMAMLVTIAFVLTISFGLTALMIYGICWAFHLTFTWRIAFGIWLILILTSAFFNKHSNKKITIDNPLKK